MSDAYTHEVVHQIWHDKTGERLEVGPDRDGLELVEIRGVDATGRLTNSIVMTREAALLAYDALGQHLGLLSLMIDKIGGTD